MGGPPAARLTDQVQAAPHPHGCPGCPHPHMGQIFTGSEDVTIENLPAARQTDKGVATACCGSNTVEIAKGSGTVFINGKAAARQTDMTLHCSAFPGQIISGASKTFIGG